jgi:hypothetical protein
MIFKGTHLNYMDISIPLYAVFNKHLEAIRKRFYMAHNPKVDGSNPSPATNFIQIVDSSRQFYFSPRAGLFIIVTVSQD